MNDRPQVNLIINNRVGGKATLIAEKGADRLYSKKQQRLFRLFIYESFYTLFLS
jgi:hypothetical protein